MMLSAEPRSAPWIALAVSFAAAWALARLAPRIGLVDGADLDRKLQARPVPTVGGPALFLALVAATLAGAGQIGLGGLLAVLGAPEIDPSPAWTWAALACAFALGLADDLSARGLAPGAKLAGQTLAGALLAAPLVLDDPGPAGLALAGALVLGAVAAQNALNTFDNADGAAAGLALASLVPIAWVAAGALAGFLPFNLRRADGRAFGGRLPRAFLGDSGSHLLGLVLLLSPAAWGALALPLFDLARLAVVRWRAGQAPWVGDRRHLAHRLERRGLAPLGVALLLVAIALPAILAVRRALEEGELRIAVLGLGATAAAACAALWIGRPGGPPHGAAAAAPGVPRA